MALINIGAAPNDGTGDNLRTAFGKLNDNNRDNVVVVKDVSDFGTISQDKAYYIDGVVDIGSANIEIGAGITLIGGGTNVSKIIAAGSGGFITNIDSTIDIRNLTFERTSFSPSPLSLIQQKGVNDSNSSIDIVNVNLINIDYFYFGSYIRSFFADTMFMSGKYPSFVFSNACGGIKMSNILVRSLDPVARELIDITSTINFSSRLSIELNADFNTDNVLTSFEPANFATSNQLQFKNCQISRNGVIDSDDTSLFPNISEKDVKSNWRDNIGLPNTNKGATLTVTTEAVTALTQNTWTDLAGTFTLAKAQHIDNPANGQLRNLDDTSVYFNLAGSFTLEGTANDLIDIRASIFRAATSTFEPQEITTISIQNNLGAIDLGTGVLVDQFQLKNNDYVKIEVQNTTSSNDITALENSKFRLDGQ